jgi:ribosome-associated toxin RatA of RatAB toxin-antitoxin module
MPKIDVTDEAVLDAPPMEVYKTILDMYSGVALPWMPSTTGYKPRGDKPICEGTICDVAIRGKGITLKITDKVTKIVEGKLIEMKCSGDFVGTGMWTFEPTEDGKTKVQFRFNARTNRLLMSIFSPFVNLAKGHSDMMQEGFKAYNDYLMSQK